MMKRTSELRRQAPLSLASLKGSASWIPEPLLRFSNGKEHVDPRIGIPLYGPRSWGTSRHKREIHVGFIGTGESVGRALSFYQKCSAGIDGDDAHAPFPGCREDVGLRCGLQLNDSVEKITRQEAQRVLDVRYGRQRFEMMLGLLGEKLELLTQKDHPLDYIVVALPEELCSKCRVTDYTEKGSKVHRDLRRAFKALAMEFRKPTQILQEATTGLLESTRDLDHEATIAWNLFTGLYFKVDGLPWGPVGLTPGTCFVGISFFRPLGNQSSLRTSVVQAFDENGEGLVLRGHDFHWQDGEHNRSPHLPADEAKYLVNMVLDCYEGERKQTPHRVVIHKASRFEPEERAGFEAALSRVKEYDLVAVHPVSNTRLIRSGTRPVLRGTSFELGDLSFLYTTGFVPELGRYPHGHVPSPLLLADHVGDTPMQQLLGEILALTKMNWNSADVYGLMPITLRFSRLVGDILREVPLDHTPRLQYKYYM